MNDPTVEADGESWVYTWDELGISIGFDKLRDRSDGLHAEMWVVGDQHRTSAKGHISWGTFNLSSPTARSREAKLLHEKPGGGKIPVPSWQAMLEHACVATAMDSRKGQPAVELSEVEVVLKPRWLLHPLLVEGQPTMLYGPGDSSKGWLALAICACMRLGGPVLPGLTPVRQCNSLYLDWEADTGENARRLEYIQRGLGFHSKIPGVFHRKMYGALADDLPRVREFVDKTKAELVVIDSVGMAAAGDIKESDPAQRFMAAIRQLKVTPLLLAHVTKAASDEEVKGRRRVLGSYFYELLARSLWEVRTNTEYKPATTVLSNRKANIGPKQGELFFTLTIQDEPAHMIRFGQTCLASSPWLADGLSLEARMVAALSRGKRSTAELADELGVTPNVIRTTGARLLSHENSSIVKVAPKGGKGGRGNETEWGLAAFAGGSVA